MSGQDHGSPRTLRPAIFEVSVIVRDGRAECIMAYNGKTRRSELINRWLERWVTSLSEFAVILEQTPLPYTLSDFPLLSLDYGQLQKLQSKLTRVQNDDFSLSGIQAIFPATGTQNMMLSSQQHNHKAYRPQLLIEVSSKTSDIVVETLKVSWNLLVETHEILRSFFIEDVDEGKSWLQVVLRAIQPRIDVRTMTSSDDIMDLFKTQKKFEQHEPPYWVTICLSPSQTYLYADFSHTVMDQLSLQLILNGLSEFYAKKITSPMEVPQYRAITSHIQAKADDPAVEYWSNYLKKLKIAPLSESESLLLEFGDIKSTLTRIVSAKEMQDLAKAASVTASALFRLGWAVVLRGLTRKDQIAFEYVVSGRDMPVEGIEKIVGPVLNILPCWKSLNSQRSLRELLQDIHGELIENLQFQHNVPQVKGARGILRTLVNFRRMMQDGMFSGELEYKIVKEVDPFDYDVVVECDEGPAGVEVKCTYWDKRVEDEVAETICDDLVSLLRAIPAHMEGTVGDLDQVVNADISSWVEA